MIFQKDDLILFQGDSITDAARLSFEYDDLGVGYAAKAARWLQARHPAMNLRFVNRGIGGNRVADLRARWTEDAIAIQPNWISILIGINDTWRRYDRQDMTSVETFEADYRHILERVKKETRARIILMEPFVLPTPADRVAWREDLDPKIQAVRRLAAEFAEIYIPLDGIFARAAITHGPAHWAHDGVHPTQIGYAMIAQEWLKAIGAAV
jgi:lysophospholipase L1-like esterase